MKSQGAPSWHAGHDTVTFAGPAPAGAHLRLSAIGGNIQGSFNGGATWTTLNRQPSDRANDGGMAPYWHPIPQGTISVKLRGGGWWGGGWRANYAAVWSQGVTVGPPPATATPIPPTRVPTSGPIATPTPTLVPTTAPAGAPGFVTGAGVTPTTVAKGGTATIAASIKSATTATVVIDIEVYGPSGARVYQQAYDNQAFAAGQTRTYQPVWTVPTAAAAGTYTVKIGVFSAGWGAMYTWNNGAATFAVK